MLMTQDVLIVEIISSFWENIYLELFSISIKRAARRGYDTPNLLSKKKKLGEHDYARNISTPSITQKDE